MTDDGHSRDEHIELMRNPEKWPHSFVLPLTKPDWQVGFLVQLSAAIPTPPPDPTVVVGNIFEASAAIDRGNVIVYGSLEAVYDDGWRVN